MTIGLEIFLFSENLPIYIA